MPDPHQKRRERDGEAAREEVWAVLQDYVEHRADMDAVIVACRAALIEGATNVMLESVAASPLHGRMVYGAMHLPPGEYALIRLEGNDGRDMG